MNSSNRPMFKVIVTMAIWTHEESVVLEHLSERSMVLGRDDPTSVPKVAILRKELMLSFAPFPGLQLESDGWDCRPLESVKWSDEDQEFRCTAPDEYPRMALDTYLSFEDLLLMSLEDGWFRPDRGGGDAPRSA